MDKPKNQSHDYYQTKIYTQDQLDTFKSQAHLAGQLEQFLIDEKGDADISKIKQVASFLKLALKKYGDSLPHDAAIAAEFVESGLEMLIESMP